ncbi:MAG: hypothetical protein K8T89_21195, partial [Planctomycetes bacterium]|nr:hypothetical protein [Planctomycetota bacterium]
TGISDNPIYRHEMSLFRRRRAILAIPTPGTTAMPITLNCPKCHKPFRVRDESVGMKVKCPTCGAVLQVPSSLSPASLDTSKIPGSESPAMPPKRPAGPAAPARTARPEPNPESESDGGSFFNDLPAPGPISGPPSLAVPQMRRRGEPEDEDMGPRRSAPSGPLPSARKPSAAKPKPAAKRQAESEEPESVEESAAGWRKVRKGLGWVRLGIFLALLPAAASFGIVIYCFQEHTALPQDVKMNGVTGKGLSLWTEIELASTYGGGVLVYLLLLLGRKGCTHVPSVAKTRGLAGGTLFFTFLAFVAFATYATSIVMPIFAAQRLPHEAEIKPFALMGFVFIGFLAEMWFMLFVAQAGIPLASMRIIREIALSAFLLIVLPVGVYITNHYYYALLLNSPKLEPEKILETNLIQHGIYFLFSALFVIRIFKISGLLKRSIRNWFEENRDALPVSA